MKLHSISDQDLKIQTELSVQNERRSIREVVEHISEVERRRLFLDWGYSSLFDFLTRHCKYSEAAAYRRMQAARALHSVPELRNELESGHLNLTQISKAQSVFKSQEKMTGMPVSTETKKSIFSELRTKSKKETEKILDANLPGALEISPSSETHKSDDSVVLTVRLPKKLYEKLLQVKQLYGHIIPDGQWPAILEKMTDDVISKRDPARDPIVRKTKTTQSFAAAEGGSHPTAKTQPGAAAVPKNAKRSIPNELRRKIFRRDQFCQHQNANGKLCRSEFQLEIDHIKPIFAGGQNDCENLRLLCRTHNQHRYRRGANIRSL